MYCMFLNDLTGKAPVRFVYMVPVVESARAAKQNISWAAQALWAGNIRSTLARAKITSACLLHVDAVLKRWQRMWPLLVAVDRGRWARINAGVSPGMVCSLVLLSRASRRVAASGERSSWSTYRAYSAAEEEAPMFAANLMEFGLVVGMVVGGMVFSAKGIIHRPTLVHLWLQMIILLRYMIVQPILEKVTMHPALHIVTMDRSKCKARTGIM